MRKEWINWIFGDDLQYWANVSQIAGLAGILLAVLALTIADRQLRLAARATYAQLILMIDDAFYNFEEVRAEINEAMEHNNRAIAVKEPQWFRYMAIFERLGVMLDSKLVSGRLVNELYGERFEKLLTCNRGNLELRPEVAPAKWPGFISLWKVLKKHRNSLPEPPKNRDGR
jgi:hypothetical protein